MLTFFSIFAPSISVNLLNLWVHIWRRLYFIFFIGTHGNSSRKNESYTNDTDQAMPQNASIYKVIWIPLCWKAIDDPGGSLSWYHLESGACLNSECSHVPPECTVMERVLSRVSLLSSPSDWRKARNKAQRRTVICEACRCTVNPGNIFISTGGSLSLQSMMVYQSQGW